MAVAKGPVLERDPIGKDPARRKPRVAEKTGIPEVDDLRERVLDLEARLRALAVSRRVLITLLVSSDKKRKVEVARLRGEVEKLRERNRCHGRAVAARDAAIHHLRYQMSELVGPDIESPADSL